MKRMHANINHEFLVSKYWNSFHTFSRSHHGTIDGNQETPWRATSFISVLVIMGGNELLQIRLKEESNYRQEIASNVDVNE